MSGARTGALDPGLVHEVRARLAAVEGTPSADQVAAVVRERGAVLGSASLADLVAAVRAELLGAGPLQPLLDAPDVTDVLVTAPDRVWVDRGGGVERTDVRLPDEQAVRTLAIRLATAGGQRLDDACPVVDARLPDGTRVHAVLPPVSGAGTLISLRVLRPGTFSLAALVRTGSVPPSLEPVLRGLVDARANVLISGATGTGKTTLLASLLTLVPVTERIVVIEEAGELHPAHPHVVRLLARRPNVEGVGGVGLTELVRHALRMRPDRIVLGECRGPEVREVLTALNTGHDGGWTTLHANAATDVPARLEALGAMAGMPRDAVALQAASAIDAVLHLRRSAGRRYLAEVAVVHLREASTDRARLSCAHALRCTPDGRVAPGEAWPSLAARLGLDAGRGGLGEGSERDGVAPADPSPVRATWLDGPLPKPTAPR